MKLAWEGLDLGWRVQLERFLLICALLHGVWQICSLAAMRLPTLVEPQSKLLPVCFLTNLQPCCYPIELSSEKPPCRATLRSDQLGMEHTALICSFSNWKKLLMPICSGGALFLLIMENPFGKLSSCWTEKVPWTRRYACVSEKPQNTIWTSAPMEVFLRLRRYWSVVPLFLLLASTNLFRLRVIIWLLELEPLRQWFLL